MIFCKNFKWNFSIIFRIFITYNGGMKPKIATCIEAISKGVNEATILDGRISHALILELFTEHGIGTQIYSKLNVKNKK